MSVSTISYVQVQLVKEAEEAIAQIKKEVCSSHDIIPRTELGPVSLSEVGSLWKKYGFRGVRFLQNAMFGHKVDAACMAAFRQIKAELKFPSSAIAIAHTKFGVGECQAVANLAAAKLYHLKPCMMQLENHVFLVLGVQYADLDKAAKGAQTSDCVEILDHLKKTNAVIMDPFLGCVSPVSEYPQKAQSFLQYIKVNGTQKGKNIGQWTWNQQERDTVLAEADRLYTLAKPKLGTKSTDTGFEAMQLIRQGTLGATLDGEILPSALDSAKDLFPELTWKKKVDIEGAKVEWLVWARCTKDQANPVSTNLQGLSFKVSVIKVQKSEDVVVMLVNPNALELRVFSVMTRIFSRDVVSLINAYAAD